MAGTNNLGTYLNNTSSAVASAGITEGHWRIFSSGTVNNSGGIYAVDANGQSAKLNTYLDSVAYTNTINSSLQSQINVISGSFDSLEVRVDTLELSASNHNVKINNLESTVTTISNSLATIMQGSVVCDTTNHIYSVLHPSVNAATVFPMITLSVPNSGSILFIQSVTNRSNTGFDIVLSDVPSVTGYRINWTLPLSGSAVVVRAYGISEATLNGGSYTPDAGVNDTFALNYQGSVTINDPTSMSNGQTINIIATSNSAGSQLSWGLNYRVSGGSTSSTISGTPLGVDIFTILRRESNYYVTYSLDMA